MYIKILVIFVFVVCISLPVFATEAEGASGIPLDSPVKKGRESVFALGFEYGNFWGSFFDGTQDIKTYRSFSAINFHGYSFWDGSKVGIFAHILLFGFPNMGTVHGIQTEYPNFNGLQTAFLFGPLFRHSFNEKLDLLYGAGPGFSFTRRRGSFSALAYNVGIGVNIMLRYMLSGSLGLFAGNIFNYDFLSFVEESNYPSQAINAAGSLRKFSMFGLRPYVSIGIKL
jgi:hypothetical protein